MAQSPTIEAALTLAKERYAQAAKAGRVGVWDWNPTTGDIFIDPVLKALLGCGDAEIPDRIDAWMARVHPEDRAIVDAEAAALLADERPTYDVEHRMTHKDGSTRWFLSRGAATRNAAGDPERIVGTTTDITDQKAAQASLASALNELERVVRDRTTQLDEAGRRYRDLFDRAPVMYVTIRRRNGQPTVEVCNELFLRLLGYVRADVIGSPLADFYTPQSRQDMQRAAIDGPLDAAERQLVAKYGGVLDTLLHAVPETDRSGAIVGTRAMYVDITERKRADARHHDAQSRYRLLVEQSLVGLYIIQDGQVVYINPKMAEISGYPRDAEAQLLSILDLVVEEDRALVSQNIQRRMTGRMDDSSYTVRIRRKDGRIVPLEVSGALIQYRGRPAVAGVALDISERLRLGNQVLQSQKLESVGTLAGGVAHAFNNALTAICGRCELLLGEISAADPRRSDVEAILSVAEESANLTRQLLAVGRRQVLAAKEFDLNVAVGTTLEVAAPLIDEQIRVSTELESRLGLVKADPGQIEQALVNVILNARDAMSGGGTLTVATTNVELDDAFHQTHPDVPPGPYVLLTVTDTGEGMSEETVKHVFEPFFTTKEFGRGTGLGLATVHGIIRQTGGHVLVESTEGRGTSVAIYLPRLPDDAVAGSDRDATDGEPLETILLVEDEPHVRRSIGDMLTQVGYHVLAAPNADEAMLISSQHRGRIDLLLTDVVMPGMSGWQLAAELTRIRRGTRVLYMTGYTTPHSPIELRDDPSLLQKPFSPKALRRAVRRVFDEES